MRNKANQKNIDKSDLTNYPNGRIKDDGGSGDGTAVNEQTKGDIHEFFDKLLRLYGLEHNGLPDNEENGYQTIEALNGLANKNNYIYDLTSNSNVLSLPIKVDTLNNNESFTVKASQDKGSETTLKGTLDNVTKSVAILGDYLAGDYLRVINTDSGINIIRLVDFSNFTVIAGELGFLKKATGAEVIEGILDNKALTPESFLEAFAEYVIGNTSDNFLADIARNGIYPKEHFEKVEGLVASADKYGTVLVGNVDSGSVGDTYPVTGDFTSATIYDRTNEGNEVEVVLSSSMNSVDYTVVISIESLSSSITRDNDIQPVVWKKISTTKFRFYVEESYLKNTTNNIKLHFDIKQR